MFRIHVYVPLSMSSVHCRALSLCGWGINVLWWLHIVEPTRCLWTCNELIGLYVSVECDEVEGSFQDTTQKNEDSFSHLFFSDQPPLCHLHQNCAAAGRLFTYVMCKVICEVEEFLFPWSDTV